MQKIILDFFFWYRGIKWQKKKKKKHLPQAMDDNYHSTKKIKLIHLQKANPVSEYRKKLLKYLNYIFPGSSYNIIHVLKSFKPWPPVWSFFSSNCPTLTMWMVQSHLIFNVNLAHLNSIFRTESSTFCSSQKTKGDTPLPSNSKCNQ